MCSCVEVIKETRPIAKKQYDCDASEFVKEWLHYHLPTLNDEKISISELRSLIKARREYFKILPGTRYVKQINKMDGKIYTWRTREDLFSISVKYKLFSCEC